MKATTTEFSILGGITAIVMDESEFNELVDSLAGIFEVNTGQRTGNEQIQMLKKAKHIPLMARGTKTQFVFDKYNVKTDKLSVVVRGEGVNVANKYLPQ